MSLSDSILSGAVVSYRKAGYTFGRHLHTNIEIYRILSGECYMDIQSENLHCTKGDFIMILPDVVHSFYLNDTSDCEFQHIHFNPDMMEYSRLRFFMLYYFLHIFIIDSSLMKRLISIFRN